MVKKYAGADRQKRSAFNKINDLQTAMAYDEGRIKRPMKKKKKLSLGLFQRARKLIGDRPNRVNAAVKKALN